MSLLFRTALALGAVISLMLSTAQAESPRTITITATETVTAVPDLARISLGVEAVESTSSAALRQIRRNMNTVFAVLEEAGIAPRDRQTSGLSLQPIHERRTDQRRPRITGYTARNGLTVRVRDLTMLGPLLDNLTGAGANTLNGISFGIAETDPLSDEARRAAAQAAKARAELYADALDITLGDLLSLQEAGGFQPQPRMMAMADAAMARESMPVAEGEVSLSATVTLVYAIAD
jgi:uncharacterized protein YggE